MTEWYSGMTSFDCREAVLEQAIKFSITHNGVLFPYVYGQYLSIVNNKKNMTTSPFQNVYASGCSRHKFWTFQKKLTGQLLPHTITLQSCICKSKNAVVDTTFQLHAVVVYQFGKNSHKCFQVLDKRSAERSLHSLPLLLNLLQPRFPAFPLRSEFCGALVMAASNILKVSIYPLLTWQGKIGPTTVQSCHDQKVSISKGKGHQPTIIDVVDF